MTGVEVFRGEAQGVEFEIHRLKDSGAWVGLKPSPAFLGTDDPPTGIARHYLEHRGLYPKVTEIDGYCDSALVFRYDKGILAWWRHGWVRADGSVVIARINDKILGGIVEDGVAKVEEFLEEGPNALADLEFKAGGRSVGEMMSTFQELLRRV